jgi:hypothetical protein
MLRHPCMQVHAFRGTDRVFAFTADATACNLPAQYAPWTPFKILEMTRGENIPGVRVDECLDDLEKHGFHLTEAHIRITDRVL